MRAIKEEGKHEELRMAAMLHASVSYPQVFRKVGVSTGIGARTFEGFLPSYHSDLYRQVPVTGLAPRTNRFFT